ncbi:MAG: hypothetical protein RIT14_29 [Pseudomonadota bacterium]
MQDAPQGQGLPFSLRALKWLVTVLTVTMIAGVITVVGLLVTRMPDGRAPVLPESLILPEGTRARAVTTTADSLLVVTEDDRLLIFSRTGQFQREIPLQD